MRTWLICLSSLMLSSCVSLPDNSTDFREFSKQHKEGSRTVTVDAGFDTVVARLKSHVEKCNSIEAGYSRFVDGSHMATNLKERVIPKWEKSGASTATLLIIQDAPQKISQPKGGQILCVVDVTRKGAKTVVSIFGLNGVGWTVYDYIEEFTSTVRAQPGKCQLEIIQKENQ